MKATPDPVSIVVAAAIIERHGRFLITKRQKGVHLEGLWEFPGGKREEDEALAACLARELREELDVDIDVGVQLFQTSHSYGDRTVELHFLSCTVRGTPRPRLGQEMRWATREELTHLEFPAADAALIQRLTRLPGDERQRRDDRG